MLRSTLVVLVSQTVDRISFDLLKEDREVYLAKKIHGHLVVRIGEIRLLKL